MSLAVFLKPNDALNREICRWKKIVNKKFNNSYYCNHPPHSTLINVDVENYNLAIEDIKKTVNMYKSFEIIVDDKNVFWDDMLTGGHTIYFEIKKNSNLHILQKMIAKSLKDHVIRKPASSHIRNDEKLHYSYKNYGFPFIGEHWLPHFTVASIKTSKNDSLIKNFLKDDILEKFVIYNCSIWIIDGDNHNMVDNINLI